MDVPEGYPVRTSGDEFVGRGDEIALLRVALDDVLRARGRLFLLAGEPGIGKTRLAAEVSTLAEESGFSVVWGRCWEAGGAPAYWPWVQCLRGLIRERGWRPLVASLGSGAALVAQLLPEIAHETPSQDLAPALEAEGARFKLFDAVSQLLRTAAEERPILLVLDDLHAADTPSLLLLRFAAPELLAARVLVLGLYRSTEIGRDHPLHAGAAELERHRRAERLPLRGLGATEVARYIQTASGFTPSPSMVQAVHAKTEGNPLFVGELVRLLSQEATDRRRDQRAGLDVTLTRSVRDVIDRRLEHLSSGCLTILRLASIIGADFDVGILKRIAQHSRPALLALLDEGRAALVVAEVPGSMNRWRFEHVLIRDALYEDVGLAERVDLHRQVGEALEALYGSSAEEHLTELAHHYWRAAGDGDGERAFEYARRAGDRAISQLAFEEAARLYEMALEALDLTEVTHDETHCRLLLALGDALARGGDLTGARKVFLHAADVARRLSRADLLGAAALGYGGRLVWAKSADDALLVPLLREAVAASEQDPGLLRARLLARLSATLRDEPPRELAAAVADEAVELARRLGDQSTLAYVLVGRYAAAWWPENPAERLAIASELVELARASGDAERIAEGLDLQLCAYLELGEIRAVDECLSAMTAVVEELGQSAQRWVLLHTRAMRAILDGRFEEASQLIPAALSVGEGNLRGEATITFNLQRFVLLREQGRLGEVEAIIKRSIRDHPRHVAFPCMLAQLHAELGRAAEARGALEALAANDFTDLSRKSEWLFAMCVLADVVHFLRDERRAGLLYELMRPFAGRVATISPEICVGSVSRPLGVLSSIMGSWDASAAHFEEAIASEMKMGARPWLAHTQYEYAQMLLARDGGPGPRANQLLADALEIASSLGMLALEAKIAALAAAKVEPEHRSKDALEPALRDVERAPRIFRREGDYWTVSFEGDTFRIRDTKGLGYISALLRAPSREFLALELTGQRTGADGRRDPFRRREPSMPLAGPSDAGNMLDEQAKAEYRQRLTDLEAEIIEAEDWADPERAARARHEREVLIRELSRAVGMGGRDRKAGSDLERARLSVTKSIRSAIARINQYNPVLGEHLSHTIRTGTMCSYNPDPGTRLSWQL